MIDQFDRIGDLEFPGVNPILRAANTTFYRNKLEFTFSNKRWLSSDEIKSAMMFDRNGVGFHIPKQYDKIVDIETCFLQKDPSNAIRNQVRSFARKNELSFYDKSEFRGLLRNLIIRTSSTDQLMILVQFGEDDMIGISKMMNFLDGSFPEIDSLFYVINTKKNETFHDLAPVLFSGKEHIEEKIGDLTFKIGPKSFFQTNTEQTEKLYEKAAEMAGLTGSEVVYDLYTGAGTIANYISKNAVSVVGIENVKEAIEDAVQNSQLNGINNCHFIAGDILETLNTDIFTKFGQPDVVITDPPRAGMHKEVVEKIIASKANKIVYISCNPATQARDLIRLTDVYRIQEVQPFDMFPHTHHLENIVSLKIKN